MSKNAIILTSGLSGSSVLTGLIRRAGYWPGDETFKKDGYETYETYENQKLIALNRQLFREVGYTGNYQIEFSAQTIESIAALHKTIDCREYRSFIEECTDHRPWVWKDPRLWLTIRFWRKLLDVQQCRFILLTRGALQSWVSSLLRRQIMTYRYSLNYEGRIRKAILDFLDTEALPYLHVEYERLIRRPADAIADLNSYLGTNLGVEDLKQVYHKPLYKSPRSSFAKHIEASLIYLKNYSDRLDISA